MHIYRVGRLSVDKILPGPCHCVKGTVEDETSKI
jgi:hypothetical protein